METDNEGSVTIKVFDTELVQKSWLLYDLGTAICHFTISLEIMDICSSKATKLKKVRNFVEALIQGYTDGRNDLNMEHLRQACMMRASFINFLLDWSQYMEGTIGFAIKLFTLGVMKRF